MRSVSGHDFLFKSGAMAAPWRSPSSAEDARMRDQLRDLARNIAGWASARGQECLANGHEPSARAELFADWQLAYLHALRQLHEAAEVLAAEAALMGGGMGATYGDLGSSWGITKQAARKKWPGAVDDGSGRPEKITVEKCGGVAEITYLPDRGAWSWRAHGGDGTCHEAEEAYTVRWKAMIAAEYFLRDHVDCWGDTNVPMALGDPKKCWCWDDDARAQKPINDA
ncbi:hypothetical protein ACH4S9_39250 [Streptomyces sp. NPDC021225]|uniref:hypothetical protein n=1 Tax=Streptomyces sp. NPDC021225 TaxID=3365121 RepID=UPI0037AA5BD3